MRTGGLLNMSLKEVAWPTGLEGLTNPVSVRTLNNVMLPSALVYLHLGVDFRSSLLPRDFPRNLILDCIFDTSIAAFRFPRSLKDLSLLGTFNESL